MQCMLLPDQQHAHSIERVASLGSVAGIECWAGGLERVVLFAEPTFASCRARRSNGSNDSDDSDDSDDSIDSNGSNDRTVASAPTQDGTEPKPAPTMRPAGGWAPLDGWASSDSTIRRGFCQRIRLHVRRPLRTLRSVLGTP